MKKCPFCAEEIHDAAIKCKHCGSMLDGSHKDSGSRVVLTRESNFSLVGLLGAFIAVVGFLVGAVGVFSRNPVVGVIGIVMIIIGAGLGAKYK